MNLTSLTAVSPIDGRYERKLRPLRALCSEYGLIRFRIQVELAWLRHLSQEPSIEGLSPWNSEALRFIDDLLERFDPAEAAKVKAIEARTNHDVKAVEYYLKDTLAQCPALAGSLEFIHFGCTSEDINNLAYALMLREARAEVLRPAMVELEHTLSTLSHQSADIPMISRTHGQTASPTTVGKELANVLARLRRQFSQLDRTPIMGKMNGAVGNFNAHVVVYPQANWSDISHRFVVHLGLTNNPYTTQIEPHDWMAEFFHVLQRTNTILLDLARDIWGYISLGYFTQRLVAGEVGSSTMPHKVNPIDFENAEGNLGIANALLAHFAQKLPISRWQRDLTDSTVLRNVGVAMGHSLLAYLSLARGFHKITVDPARLQADLDNAWEVLAEPIQMMMRRYRLPSPYEQLKALTRGKAMDRDTLHTFIDGLALPPECKDRLKALTPATYLGLAQEKANMI